VATVVRRLIGSGLSILGYIFLALAFVAAILSTALYEALSRLGLVLPAPMSPGELARLPEVREYTIEQLSGPLLTVGILWAAIALLAIIVVRTWIRRRAGGRPRDAAEERSFSIPQRSFRLAMPQVRLGRRRRSGPPTDAVAAYLAALDDLAALAPDQARHQAESPRAHAARVEIGEIGGLQADYVLARYGHRRLTDAEHRRALDRWRRLRQRLRRVR
jgi:hypothetical protein